MTTLGLSHLSGALLTLIIMAGVGIHSGRQVKNASDFAIGGGRSSSVMVAGASQLAFEYGFSSLWFCLGGGIGCLFLALFFVRPMRKSGYLTLQQMIQHEYGRKAGLLTSVLGALGIFLNIIAQLLSAMALLGALLPLPPFLCALLVAGLMVCYVVFGGMRGAGTIGLIKTVLLYACAILCVAIVFRKTSGFNDLYESLPGARYFSLFARGIGVDGGAALSLVIGVLSTQTYAQSILSAKSSRAAVEGALASSLLIPPIGLGGVYIGIYMKMLFPAMDAARTFPRFIMLYMPGFLAGIFLAVLLIAIIGCGAGLTLGISSIITSNLESPLGLDRNERKKLACTRISIVAVLLAAVVFTMGDLQSVILQWSFMSMGLRGAVLFLPMSGALFLPGRIPARYAVLSIIAGPLCVLAGSVFIRLPFDPLFLGMIVGLVIMAAGYVDGRKNSSDTCSCSR